ncbi:hypothetical protein [Riemerella columbina]|uniref:hypothetical protein n=1 Tax=Riemerella columbina TaxID=103810 RepID=UPI00266FC215|nr:hypothetical protein [Riemerella columbina]WKS95924.1 hypothetical protein NYR17_04105 [Riemerella columbina]
MIAEEYSNISSPLFLTGQKDRTIDFINQCLKKSCKAFKKALSQSNLALPLNENKYTQIYVEQVEVFIKSHPNIGVKNQYSDTFFGTKGIPDFYFHKVEEGVHNKPIIVWEVKILSNSFGKKREKEYVIGDNNNGGIERFKNEKHGKGLPECGLLGFVQDKDFNYWHNTINSWIIDLSKTNDIWKEDEILSMIEHNNEFCTFRSFAHRSSDKVHLIHLWILL